jgi:anti-anti-sigma factor
VDLNATQDNGVLVLQPPGRINHTNAEQFQQALEACRADQAAAVLMDLSRLEYISSAGLRILMLLSKKLAATRARLVVAAPQPVVAEILEISRFNLVFRIHETVEDATAALTGRP